jgi:two-component system response regulator NreC
MAIDGYCRCLAAVEKECLSIKYNIIKSYSCDDALNHLHKGKHDTPLDLILLDINLNPSSDGQYLSGEDLGLLIRKNFPSSKIIVITSLNSNYRINNILKSLNPIGLLIKSEIDFKILKSAFEAVLNNTPYYSSGVLQLMRKQILIDYSLDQLDRKLLHHISKGAKLRHLCETLPLSKSAIELRKRRLKLHFEIDGGDDRDLIIKAEELGFL